jgi:hypothetical protein
MKNLKIITLTIIASLITVQTAQSKDLFIKNGTSQAITVHLQAVHQNKQNFTRHDEKTIELAPQKSYKFRFRGTIQDVSIRTPVKKDFRKDGLFSNLSFFKVTSSGNNNFELVKAEESEFNIPEKNGSGAVNLSTRIGEDSDEDDN